MTQALPSRRTITKGTAWALPVVAVGTAAPAFAASTCPPLTTSAAVSAKVQGPGTITGGYACWGPGQGSGGDGCTGATEPKRYWVFSDGFQGPVSCANYNVLSVTQTITATSGSLGPHTYTFTGSVMTNFGNHNYVSAYGAGVALQTSTDAVTWTTRSVIVTRDASDTNPMAASSYTGCTWATGFTNITKLAPITSTTCAVTPRYANATYSFSITVPAGTTTMYFRRLHFVAPRTTQTLCSNASASDDIAVSDATIVCS